MGAWTRSVTMAAIVVRSAFTMAAIVVRSAFTMAAIVVRSASAAQAAECDRDCLRGMITKYVEAIVAHAPQSLPLAPNVRFKEDWFASHILIAGDASRGYGRPLTNFAPRLRAAGATDEVLRTITIDNPPRFLAFVPKRGRKR